MNRDKSGLIKAQHKQKWNEKQVKAVQPHARGNFPFRKRSLPFLRHLENFWTIIESFSTKKKDIHNPDSNPVLSYANLSPLPLHYHANPPQSRKIKVYIIINGLS